MTLEGDGSTRVGTWLLSAPKVTQETSRESGTVVQSSGGQRGDVSRQREA